MKFAEPTNRNLRPFSNPKPRRRLPIVHERGAALHRARSAGDMVEMGFPGHVAGTEGTIVYLEAVAELLKKRDGVVGGLCPGPSYRWYLVELPSRGEQRFGQ